jgi:hypothetical protein
MFLQDPGWQIRLNPARPLPAQGVFVKVRVPCPGKESSMYCTKTAGEHPMVLFIVIIAETIVHVQHRSDICHWIIANKSITRG